MIGRASSSALWFSCRWSIPCCRLDLHVFMNRFPNFSNIGLLNLFAPASGVCSPHVEQNPENGQTFSNKQTNQPTSITNSTLTDRLHPTERERERERTIESRSSIVWDKERRKRGRERMNEWTNEQMKIDQPNLQEFMNFRNIKGSSDWLSRRIHFILYYIISYQYQSWHPIERKCLVFGGQIELSSTTMLTITIKIRLRISMTSRSWWMTSKRRYWQ